MKFNYLYDYFIIFIIIIKISYYLIYIFDIIFNVFNKENTNLFLNIKNVEKWLDITFNISMALLLLYLFNPFSIKSIYIDDVVKSLLFLYAFVLLLKNFSYYINKDIIIKELKIIVNKI